MLTLDTSWIDAKQQVADRHHLEPRHGAAMWEVQVSSGQAPTDVIGPVAARARLRRVLPEYLRLVDCAKHYAHHPLPRPTDSAAANRFLAAAERMEPGIRDLLGLLTVTPPSGRRGLTFGIGDTSQASVGRFVVSAKELAKRLAIAAEMDRYLRLLAQAERLATHPAPISTDPGAAAGQVSAARLSEAKLAAAFAVLDG
jgi:hypothetical protein